MNIHRLFNFSSNEPLEFEFSGKMGRQYGKVFKKILFIWREGHWLITNRRLIFVIEKFTHSDPFFHYIRSPITIILPLTEIKDVIQEKTRIILKYSTIMNHHYYPMTVLLAIGFFKRDRSREGWMYQIYEFLCESLKQPRISHTFIPCPSCGSHLKGGENFCPTCGLSFSFCAICKSPIIDLSEQTQCPVCHLHFHRREFLEWLKIRGCCPNCRSKINQFNLLHCETNQIQV